MNDTELPAGWVSVPLRDVAEVRLGRQRSPKNHSGDHMRPYLRAANVDWNGLKLDDVKEMNFTDDELEIYRLLPGDIVLSEASGSPGEVGKPGIWDGQIEDCCFQNTLLRVRAPHMNPRFLMHLLRYEALRGGFAQGARGVGIHHLGAAKLSAWPVKVPPLAEQQRIVEELEAHLSRLEAAVDGVTRSVKRSFNLWGSVMTAVARGNLEGCVTSREMVRVDAVAEVSGGIQKQRKRAPLQNHYPFLRVANVGRGDLWLDEVHRIELFDGEFERHRLKFGDLLVVEGNGSPDQIGRAAVWREEVRDAVHQNHLIRVRPGPLLNPRYLELVWNSPLVIEQLREVARSTSGLYTLSTSKVKSVKIPLPSLERQESLAEAADRWEKYTVSARNSLALASSRSVSLRKALLGRAFTGQLVPQDPSDEPASVLLERIRAERAAQPKPKRTRRAAPRKASSAPAPEPTSAPRTSSQQELPL